MRYNFSRGRRISAYRVWLPCPTCCSTKCPLKCCLWSHLVPQEQVPGAIWAVAGWRRWEVMLHSQESFCSWETSVGSEPWLATGDTIAWIWDHLHGKHVLLLRHGPFPVQRSIIKYWYCTCIASSFNEFEKLLISNIYNATRTRLIYICVYVCVCVHV